MFKGEAIAGDKIEFSTQQIFDNGGNFANWIGAVTVQAGNNVSARFPKTFLDGIAVADAAIIIPGLRKNFRAELFRDQLGLIG